MSLCDLVKTILEIQVVTEWLQHLDPSKAARVRFSGSMWDSWWLERFRDRFFSQYSGFPTQTKRKSHAVASVSHQHFFIIIYPFYISSTSSHIVVTETHTLLQYWSFSSLRHWNCAWRRFICFQFTKCLRYKFLWYFVLSCFVFSILLWTSEDL
jgi:hypothetical protein